MRMRARFSPITVCCAVESTGANAPTTLKMKAAWGRLLKRYRNSVLQDDARFVHQAPHSARTHQHTTYNTASRATHTGKCEM